ncbi:MarR family winged helix-turn-helix transcriptional regulator [Amycolatopsis benzoatilytica]|uniref:MarR family winged helix-turn-helix transcriptional regulator n=1 Tax=Amycolatopsis benzoatilytica TaxID=346045 RepID=UPI0003643BBA|nr:MarR family winged helix-turn-helix transcriptional regulator [Amycolatopsis benzoatilytica]
MADERTGRAIGLELRRVLQAGREMQAQLAHGLGLRVTDVQALDHLSSVSAPIGTVELGDRLGIRSASAAVLVDRLVAAGHLVREPDPEDRRRVILTPTAHGRAEVRAQLAPMLDALTDVIRRLEDDEAATVLRFLAEAAETMHSYHREPAPRTGP